MLCFADLLSALGSMLVIHMVCARSFCGRRIPVRKIGDR